jgi:hypothetical protein
MRLAPAAPVLGLGLLAALAAGCTGSIVSPAGDNAPPDPTLPPTGTPTPTPTSTPNGGAGNATLPPLPAGVPADPAAAGPLPLRRLTVREYNNTVRDLLGDTTGPASQFPSDRDEAFPFHRAGGVAVQDAKLLRTAAETLSAAAVRNLAALLPCDPGPANGAGEQACARQFVTAFGLRAFRRPPSTVETERLMTLYGNGRTALQLGFPETVGLMVEAILQSPAFLYHREGAGAPAIHEGKVLRLPSYEVASRLSYFLWGSMPDKDLFAAAAAGQLGTAAEIEAQTRRMLTDARARETVASFFADWLDLGALADTAKDPQAYPEFNDALKAAMQGETRAFVGSVVFDGDGRWGTLLGAPYSFVNQALAGVYGMPGAVTGNNLQRANLPPAQRAGLLTQAGFLAITGAADGSHPVRRGKAIYEKLFCRELPPPPADVKPARPASTGGTTRERFAEHDTNDCARTCHGLIDPMGFAFENYDGIGKYRTMDNGKPVDARATMPLDGAIKSFDGAVELSQVLAGSDEVRRCFATEWVRFALLRSEIEADRASIDAATMSFGRAESSVRDLMVAVTTTRSFRYRSLSPGEVLP